MKTRKTIYLTIGILFIALDVLSTIVSAREIFAQLANDAYGIGYFLGSQLFLFVGIFFIYRARKVQQNIERRETEAMIESYGKD